MLDLPKQIQVKDLKGKIHDNVDMWRYWQLEEGVLKVEPDTLKQMMVIYLQLSM